MAWTYILKSLVTQKTYTGSTIDIEKRLKEHNSGKSFYTNIYKPWRLIYKEYYPDLIDARKRERYFKSAAGRKYIKKQNLINIPV